MMQERYVYIDSKNFSGSGNSYSVWFSDTIRMIKGVDLVCARIPNTMYNIQDGSNVFMINSTPVNMSPGFYSTNSFVTDANLNPDMVSLGNTVSYLVSEGKFIFTSASPFTFQTRYGDVLGFGSNSSIITSQIATTSNLVFNNSLNGKYFVKSSNVIDLSTTSFAFLDIEQLRDSSMVDTSSTNGNGGNVRRTFGPIPLNVPSGYIKTFTENGDYKLSIDFETPIRSLERLNITWKDYNGNTLMFNGFDNNSILLRFRCMC